MAETNSVSPAPNASETSRSHSICTASSRSCLSYLAIEHERDARYRQQQPAVWQESNQGATWVFTADVCGMTG
jgi:hypothetical protein